MSDAEDLGNQDPQEVAGKGSAGVDLTQAEVVKDQALNDEDAVSFRPRDVIDEMFVSEPIPIVIDPIDGLPKPVDDFHRSNLAPPFSHDSLVCIEDDRVFVEIFDEELSDSPRPQIGRARILVETRSAWTDDGSPTERREFSPSQVVEKWGVHWVPSESIEGGWLQVRPIRPACVHYRRTVFCADPTIPIGEFGYGDLHRNCQARRSVGGAFMSLRDEAVYACEIREPRDPKSELVHIRLKDKERLERKIEEVPLFNLHSKRSV